MKQLVKAFLCVCLLTVGNIISCHSHQIIVDGGEDEEKIDTAVISQILKQALIKLNLLKRIAAVVQFA
ncbi:hypothetical protein D3C80_2088250 [compost metagenome]